MFLRLTSASLLLCFGCGGNDVHHLPDGPPNGDGSVVVDGPPDGTPHGLVSMTVFDQAGTGAVDVGVPVVFINPDGTLVATVATDSTGKASADVMPGASVTVVQANTSTNNTVLQTVLGAQPGDNLRIGVEVPGTAVGAFTVNFTPIAGVVNSYSVIGPCFPPAPATGGTATLMMFANCKLDTMDIVVIATSAAGVPLGFLEQTGVAFVAGGSTTIPAAALQPMATFNATYSNLPVEVTGVGLTRLVPDGFGLAASTNMTPTGTTLALSVLGAQPATALVRNLFQGPGRARQQLFQNLAGNVTTYGVDASTTLLPWLGTVTMDVTTGIVTEPVSSAGTTGDTPDLAVLQVAYNRPAAVATTTFRWLVFGPDAGNFTLPTMPAEVGAVNPSAGDVVSSASNFIIESDSVANYDAIRATPYKLLLQIPGQRIDGTKLRVGQTPPAP